MGAKQVAQKNMAVSVAQQGRAEMLPDRAVLKLMLWSVVEPSPASHTPLHLS